MRRSCFHQCAVIALRRINDAISDDIRKTSSVLQCDRVTQSIAFAASSKRNNNGCMIIRNNKAIYEISVIAYKYNHCLKRAKLGISKSLKIILIVCID
jgi:hypothetical protein